MEGFFWFKISYNVIFTALVVVNQLFADYLFSVVWQLALAIEN